MFRWVQIKEEEAQCLEEEGKISMDRGNKNVSALTSKKMVELHVDTSNKACKMGT